MNGILVINHFLKGQKFDELHAHLIKSAKNEGIDLTVKTNQEMLFYKGECDFVLFWDKDTNAAKMLENRGYRVFNSAKAIALCDDKAKTYLCLEGIVKQPKTIIAPLSFFKSDYSEFVNMAIKELGLPVVFKECYGSFGQQVHLCRNASDVLKHINDKPFLLQEFIADSRGEDIRLEVVDGVVVSAMKRTNKNDFRSNITNGGSGEKYTPTDTQKALAIKACEALGLTFGGVDILKGDYVCEVNSNAHIINIMNINNIDIAPLIFKAIKGKI